MPEDEAAPQFLAIGHVARDLLPDGGWRLGGTVTFAALTAQRLGLGAAVVTSASPDVLDALKAALPSVAIAARPAPSSTTFENIYTGPIRRQYLRASALPLTQEDVPPAWREAPLVLLGPIAREVDPQLAVAFPHATVAATPQGWLRQWDSEGLVSPVVPTLVEAILPHLDALILSRDDVLPGPGTPALGEGVPRDAAEADALIAGWAGVIPIVAVTRGPEGALLYSSNSTAEAFPGYPIVDVDPTGAGDVFAAAFLCALHEGRGARAAVDFANRVAAYSVEHEGGIGIPTREDLARRFGDIPTQE
ncbi:MAG TPA: PfkB family carbohydrate kinase [Ktedonobacterales bacterium]|jgi:sugar/nucleoside kinase (ribokinase family)|nr:PfkB family carbohydrate kinase [Ktedonobacterales bacterium]